MPRRDDIAQATMELVARAVATHLPIAGSTGACAFQKEPHQNQLGISEEFRNLITT